MKKILALALLVNLNLFTMECFKSKNKPYSYKKQYEKLIPSKKHKDRNVRNENGCFSSLATAVSRIITFKKDYLNQ